METNAEANNDSAPTVNKESEKNDGENESEVKEPVTENINNDVSLFKKPQLLIGPRRGKTVGKVRHLPNKPPEEPTVEEKEPVINSSTEKNVELDEEEPEPVSTNTTNVEVKTVNSSVSPAQKMMDNSIPLPYKEPKWGGIPKHEYTFEVLKNGKIVEKNILNTKSFYVFGRLSTSDFHMAHPTISRFHAVLQYRAQESETNPKGFYIYDLGSTHGTFLNKNRIKSNMYVRVQVGHMLKLGCSTRLFVLGGPEDDMEEESDLTVTQLKEKRQRELAEKELEQLQEDEGAKRDKEHGIDWGMGEDADEETDLTENPFASTQNEELYINDPKKTLRGWFEREGYELEYDVEEKGFGQFLCRVELPIESSRGSTMMAEALVKGKKKEAVVQCALEACRMLDRYGLLRQATHESKKRKAKDWEAEDFYDSDEDTFLDRTGTVEKKRQQRMRAAGKRDPDEVVETYDSLLKKHREVLSQLEELEREQEKVSMDIGRSANRQDGEEEEEDALDAFMNELSKPPPDKKHLSRLKSQVAVLKQEEARLRKLVNITKPANLPELKPPEKCAIPASTTNKALPLVGSRRKPGNSLKQKSFPESVTKASEAMEVEEEVEEEEEEEEGPVEKRPKPEQDKCEAMEVDSAEMRPKVIGPAMPPPAVIKEMEEEEEGEEVKTKEEGKKKNRNKRRSQHRSEKANEKKADYDPMDPDYSTWVPPQGQTGDGRTKLNEKYGY